MAYKFARCLNRDYCSVGDTGTVLRIPADAPFFCPACAHALVPAPDRRKRSSPLWPATPERLATCPNRDYCTISDQGRVLRLGLGAPFYCPECSHALVRAPDRRRHRQIHWPNVAASIIGGIAVAAAASTLLRAPARPPQAGPQPAISGVTLLPDPSLAALRSATIGLFPPSDIDEPAPRHHRTNGPRVDRASAEAAAELAAGIPGLAVMHWHDDVAPRAISMPWRQALIMAALMTPSQAPVPARVPRKDAAPRSDGAAAGIRLPFTRPLAPPPPPTEDTARVLLAGVLTPIPLPARGAANPFHITNDTPAARTGMPAAAVAPPPKSRAAPSPNSRAAKLADRKAKLAARATTAKKPPLSSTAAPHPPVAQAVHADADPAPPAAHPRIVVLPPTAQVSYAPFKDVNLPNLPTRFFMAPRPAADKPKKGSLQVDCAIETTGVPSDCHVMNAKNAAAVSDALLAWLGSGMVHYTPKSENGHPVRSRRTLTLDFPAEAARNPP